jgi:phytoene dehydrogenase-like protein
MDCDATVIGSGPNGLTAAIELARAGCSVRVVEANDLIGGGARSAELTLPGFIHDICSAIHPLAVASPAFRLLPLADFGLRWIYPPAPVAHPFTNAPAAVTERGVAETAAGLGADAAAYEKFFGRLTGHWESLSPEILGPIIHMPKHPLVLARFGLNAITSAQSFVSRYYKEEPARALFAGMAGHSLLPMHYRPSAAFGLVLTVLAHAVGWPLPEGGSQKISNALAGYFRSLGGEIVTGVRVRSLGELPPSRIVMCDVTPRQLLKIASGRLPESYQRRLRKYRYGPGIFKMDWALSEPIPWKDARCARAATVHIGGTFAEIAAAEAEVGRRRHPQRPFLILAQSSLFDRSRAPQGRHTAWAYCHVPNGSTEDMASRMEAQIEAVAPGFRDCILARHTLNTAELEARNANYVGGDINGGLQNLLQVLARPVLSPAPYRTAVKGLYICSSSTPPGGGVHGMCGYFAARIALADARIRGIRD